MNASEIDRLGDRLRSRVTAADLKLLDEYRRSFRSAYDDVNIFLQFEHFEVSGRPAKSTSAIVDKLRRSSMRLSQMQDIAGYRIVVSNIAEQNDVSSRLENLLFSSVMDRRIRPSHGYRAIHHVTKQQDVRCVEIQIRTALQHAWAELSEKVADRYGFQVKYGGGPDWLRLGMNGLSSDIASFEDKLDSVEPNNDRVIKFRQDMRRSIETLASMIKEDNDLSN
jgi:putative GTP pyrophosphokinase